MPAPFPLRQEATQLTIPSPGEHTDERFASILVRQSITLRPEHPRTEEIPYDMYCPSVRDKIEERKCAQCGVYFASKKTADIHRYMSVSFSSSYNKL